MSLRPDPPSCNYGNHKLLLLPLWKYMKQFRDCDCSLSAHITDDWKLLPHTQSESETLSFASITLTEKLWVCPFTSLFSITKYILHGFHTTQDIDQHSISTCIIIGRGMRGYNYIVISFEAGKLMRWCHVPNLFMPNGISQCYQLDQSISTSILRDMGVVFILIQILIEHSVSKQWLPWSDAAFCGVWSGS